MDEGETNPTKQNRLQLKCLIKLGCEEIIKDRLFQSERREDKLVLKKRFTDIFCRLKKLFTQKLILATDPHQFHLKQHSIAL
ncbi:uncharacterized protein MONOS_11830 [Monocercomonoides exilis]|uniref:uncharacterized protein n=1 Tax=Monocercomonoides exilis TaxID=2049356 RepID=UPI00355A2E97|nr:hypothetical protein MONOS_11830 [Monocercomonoides exilis]|eukprot:MONOS_11830.1-p1 / transcript=MONOS_11830.1 / gene=MONOS_11830 / organism=Monocercomonoides_exilis_PA203 / gene_product=unspecified product / transcript_product=unspecified product / location=Mono_scaffold00616:20691-21205(-) / protein_length=82 / sequence_SO=supercontig / SO=protein_coding / is_pseudo=false